MNEYNASECWLQGNPMFMCQHFKIVIDTNTNPTAINELKLGIMRFYGNNALSDSVNAVTIHICQHPSSQSESTESYSIRATIDTLTLTAHSNAGALYGVFHILRCFATKRTFEEFSVTNSTPAVSHRIVNHWDRSDGTVERGYAGRSIFFDDGRLAFDDTRIRLYARLLASIGVNEISINNVNVDKNAAHLILDENLPKVAELAAIFAEYNIKLYLSVHFEAPKVAGGLPTTDPLDKSVQSWWQDRANAIYRQIPTFGGFVVKADSEFRGGPASLGRTQADGANVIARVLSPNGGVVYWRCFIYNCQQDWRDTTTDRPKAAYDLFKPQDGDFDENVILQVKNGPSDFQVREPNSPLLGAMPATKQCLEFQITQEYTGQQIDLYYSGCQWTEILNFPAPNGGLTLDLLGIKITAVAGVSNIGTDTNWTGHTLAQANLYAFGRLAWNPTLTAESIANEWSSLTFGAEISDEISELLTQSRATYEKYTSPLGLCWLVNINHHYGPSPEGYEFMKWGTYHRANRDAVGIDRTSTGTGFTCQYAPKIAAKFDDIDTCPEELLLYFHRLRYDHKLKSGKTLIQHIYDTHFEGAEDVDRFIKIWKSLCHKLPKPAYDNVLARLTLQKENACEWRDVVNTYFYRHSGIPDEHGRKIYD